MYLKSLEISGFKSFARKSTLSFTSPISSIVGPNGSGKSNVAEAFRFVLGEQSMKSLRGKRGEDLIFNGSATAGRLNRAHVKVVFDNTRRIFPLEFDEISLERVVNRDSTNEYLINGSQVRLKDVLELLAKAHIGPSGHHIISQGEADRILSSSSKERKQMIEDALGLKIYHYKRAESERKLQKTEENIKTVETLRKEIAPHLRFLKKQVEKVERAFSLRGELANLYKEYFSLEEQYLVLEEERLKHEVVSPTEELERLEQEARHLKATLSKIEGQDNTSAELLAAEEKVHRLRDEKDTLSRAVGRLEGQLLFLEREREKSKRLAQSAEDRLVPLREVKALSLELEPVFSEAHAERDVERLRALLERVRERLASFLSSKIALPAQAESAKSLLKDDRPTNFPEENLSREEEIEKLLDEKKRLDQDVLEASAALTKAEEVYQKARQTIEEKKDTLRDAEKGLVEVVARQNELRAILSRISAERTRFLGEKAAFERELAEAASFSGEEAIRYSRAADPGDRASQEERRRAIEKMKIRLEELGAGGGEEMLKEYRDLSERDTFLGREIEDLEKSAATLKQLIADLSLQLENEFAGGLSKINKAFGEFFGLMFGGGRAGISVAREKKRRRAIDDSDLPEGTEPEEEVEEGIEIDVTLPHKKIRGLEMLSGGERALTSIALLFAISQVNPPPFIILDETDAALDEANSRKYGDMIENLSKYSQLILITHNRETMSRAGVIYGVTMGSDAVSKLLSIQFEEAVAVAK